MKPTNNDIFHKVKQWIRYGEEDLRLARHAATLSSNCPTRLIAYHAQQCAEKYLKAYLLRICHKLINVGLNGRGE